MKPSPPGSILICSVRVIGDVILTTPLVGILKEAYPEAAIDIVVAAGTGGFLRRDPRIRTLIEVPTRETGGKRSLAGDFGLLLQLFRKYDLAINMNASDRGNLVVASAGRRERVGFIEDKGFTKNTWKKILLTKTLPYDTAGHTAHLCKLVAESLGFSVSQLEVRLFWDDADLEAVTRRLESMPDNGGYFVIHPFARWSYKFWSMESFVKVSDELARQTGLMPVWTASPDPAELDLLDTYVPLCAKRPLTIRGEFSLNQMACLISGSGLYLGLDTAVSHIAASTGVPMIALYGPTAMNRWFPWNNMGAADQFYNCPRGTFRNGQILSIQQECEHPGCVHERCNEPCIPRIEPAEVIDGALTLLQEYGKGGPRPTLGNGRVDA